MSPAGGSSILESRRQMAYLTLERQQEIDHVITQVQLDTGLAYPENSLLEIAKALNLEVMNADFGERSNVRGAVDPKKRRIYLNANYRTREVNAFTLAHEIGHYLLHDGQKLRIDKYDYSQNTKESQEESEANYFAASLLVPARTLARLLSLTEGGQISEIAKYFGVSEPVIRNRIQWLTKNQTRQIAR